MERGVEAPANKGPAGGQKRSSNQQHMRLLCQAPPQKTWPPGARVSENSAFYGYRILLCRFWRESELCLSIKALHVWSSSLTTKPQNLRFSHPQKPCLQRCLFSGCMSRGKCRTSLKSTIARRVLSKCIDYGKIALYLVLVVKTRRVEREMLRALLRLLQGVV